jgi:hypothetical protein
MPIVIVIMPHIRLMSRSITVVHIDTPWYTCKYLVSMVAICGIFIFTHAAQFALHDILTSSANRIH